MTVTNSQLLNTMRDEASSDYQMRVPEVPEGGTGAEVFAVLDNSELLMNEFISTLVNRIGKTQFLNKVWKNSLSELKGGQLTYGKTIQQIFSELVERKGFGENYGSSPESSLIGKTVPTVDSDLLTQNYEFKYKVSISYDQLRGAFLTETGVADMVSTLFIAQQNRAELDEYELMRGILSRKTESTENGAKLPKGIIQRIVEDSTLKTTAVKVMSKGFTSNDLAVQLKVYGKKMKFQTQKYNLSKMTAHTPLEDLVIFTSPEYEARLDVETLAFAFNMDKAKAPNKILTIDEFPQYTMDDKTYNVVAVLADKDIVQQHDTIVKMKSFDNGESLHTNFWLHRHGISAVCKFAQCFVILEEVQA